MNIDISKFEREIAAEYVRRYESEMRQGGQNSYDLTLQIVNVAATAAAIAIKQYHEKLNVEK